MDRAGIELDRQKYDIVIFSEPLVFLSINRTIKADFSLGSIPNAGIELISTAIRESDLAFAFTEKWWGQGQTQCRSDVQGSGSANPNLPYILIGKAILDRRGLGQCSRSFPAC